MPRGTPVSTARGKGSYAPQACDVCRIKKIKCDGIKRVCGPCVASGRNSECAWTKEPVRKPRTEAHFEALRKRADALEAYSKLLEDMLANCVCQSTGETSRAHLQFRPHEMDEDYGGDDAVSDGDITQELCVPTENLKLEDRDLLLHGITAPFRFATTKPNNRISRFPEIVENPDASCVLMVEGVDEVHYNPDFDWSRHLPSQVPLDRREHDKVLDLCFKFFTMWCMRVVPALFLRDMYRALSIPRTRTPPKTPHYSPMLHNALVALATAFSDDPRIRDLKSRQYFAAAAKNYIEEECQKPNISVVHGLSILGSFHSSQGDQMLGYMYFGASKYQSQHVDSSAWVRSGLITHDDMLDRNWAYWTTFSQDICWSLYVGREFCVPSPSEQTTIPIPFVDSDLDQIPWHYPKANIPPQPNFLSRTFAASCELLTIARRIMDVVNGLGRCGPRSEINDQLITEIDVQLNCWKSRLGPELDMTLATRPTSTPHRLMMHCTYWWPFFHRRARPIHGSDKEVDHVKLCKRAADNIMELLQTWRSLYSLRFAPVTLVQVVFSSGTIFLLLAAQATTGHRVARGSLKSALDQAELCIQYLLEIGKSWQCAKNIGGILRNLLQEQLQPVLERRSSNPSVTEGDPSFSGSSTRRSRTKAKELSPTSTPPVRSPIPDGAWDTQNIESVLGSSAPAAEFTSPDLYANLFGADSEMSGFLAMLGGETLGEAPFIAPFSMMDTSPTFDSGYMPGLSHELSPQNALIPASELADLESFWKSHFQ
ncbi:hypothetical protein B0H10DRAFT_2035936 [Mycena sp. CBHHK59/15]|nr:hypothetical protein B0H10DRAFT_2035936 [Mycena sp. CBHHK59/15]